ncbi:MAG TPA: CBS domain-containing protein [Pyrinomonadaceae bacterium]|nr:CBS domain-containing protein [Pyrinomonadaceae bacterium]
MTCSEVMTKNPKTCAPTDFVEKAAQLMKSEDVGPIPIVGSDGKLEGIITDRDIVLNVVAEGQDPKTTKIADVMSTDLITCTAEGDIEETLELMEDNQVRRIPVVDASGRLVGIISQADIATRLDDSEKTAELVEDISKAAASS